MKTSCRSMVGVPQTLLQTSSHGCAGMVTDIGPRPYIVSELSHIRNHGVGSGSLGIAMAEKQEPARLRQKQS